MSQPSFQKQLKKIFQEQTPAPSRREQEDSKSLLLQKIQVMEDERREREVLSTLKQSHRVPSRTSQKELKAFVMNEVTSLHQETFWTDLLQFGMTFTRKSLATSFALMLVGLTVIAPLQFVQPRNVLPIVKAMFVECVGVVYINGEECDQQNLHEIQSGTQIETSARSLATVFYPDYSVVRIESDSDASLLADKRDQIYLKEGGVWINASADKHDRSLKVTTPVFKAKVSQGSAGVTNKHNVSQLISANAVVEIQIDNPRRGTELVSLPPDSTIRVRKSLRTSQIREMRLNEDSQEWVHQNMMKDQEFLVDIKKKTIESNKNVAGVLPGGVTDYVNKITQSALTALTWDQQQKQQLQLSQLDELFAESLVLTEKGDKTIAVKNFEAYHEKISSHLLKISDKIAVKDQKTIQDAYIALLQEHLRILSPFTKNDPQYVIKERLEEIALSLELPSNPIAQEVTTKRLLEAHKNVSEGNISRAKEILLETAEREKNTKVTKTDDLRILSEIAQKSEELQPLVQEIKRYKVDKIRSVEPTKPAREIVTDYVTGTAFKEVESKEGEESSEDAYLTAIIVGQAVKVEEEAL